MKGRAVSEFIGRTGIWSLAAVVIAHSLVMKLGWRAPADPWIHFAGGSAIAFVALKSLARLGGFEDRWILEFMALTSGVSAAAVWEIGEFASDRWMGSEIQQSLEETMRDLSMSSLGAVATVLVAILVDHDFTSRRSKSTHPTTKPVMPKPTSQVHDSNTRGQGMS